MFLKYTCLSLLGPHHFANPWHTEKPLASGPQEANGGVRDAHDAAEEAGDEKVERFQEKPNKEVILIL